MARVNEAWNVLSKQTRRDAYDRTFTPRRHEPENPAATDSAMSVDPPTQQPFRWVYLGAVCGLIALIGAGLVVAQLAATTTRNRAPTGPIEVGDCVTVRMGMAALIDDCDEPNDGRVERIIARSESCTDDERRADASDGSHAICLGAD